MTLGVRQTMTGMGVQSPHPFETDRHNGTLEPTRRMYQDSGRREGTKQLMGDPGPQILTPGKHHNNICGHHAPDGCDSRS